MKRSLFAVPAALASLLLVLAAGPVPASEPGFEIYGHVMTDAGFRSGAHDPDWFDVMRPTRLPAFEGEFGEGGATYFSVRQTRFGVRTSQDTDLGELWGMFEWELFGVGADAGQTTLRLRHAYLELGAFGAGQYWSPFMDIDVFPNSIEYWGPSGMVFFRNVQVRWMPVRGDTRFTVALERPGASGDRGEFEDRVELDDVQGRFPVPDLSAEYRVGRTWGYVEFAGMLRYIRWDDAGTDSVDYSGDAVGWGVNVSSNLRLGDSNTVRLQAVFGEGIENYMNDSSADIGIVIDSDAPGGIRGEVIPQLGLVAFLDHAWNDRWTSSVGYSLSSIDNLDGQSPGAFATGHYALVNLLHKPVPNLMVGAEVQYGRRENHSDGGTADDLKLQFSFKYSFARLLGGDS